MNRRELLLTIGGGAFVSSVSASAQAPPPGDTLKAWAAKADSPIPELLETEQLPVHLVRAVAAP